MSDYSHSPTASGVAAAGPAGGPDAHSTFSWSERLHVTVAIVVGLSLGRWVAGQIGLPAADGIEASLLAGDAAWHALPLAAVTATLVAFVAWAIAHKVHPDAALLGAASALAGIGLRGGSILSVLQASSGPSVYILLSIETLLLGLVLYAVVLVVSTRTGTQPPTDPLAGKVDRAGHGVAMAMQALILACAIYLASPTTHRQQTLIAVLVGCYLGTLAACYLLPASTRAPFWISPIVVGMLGYLLAYWSPGNWETGRSGQHLSHPLPLDYAGPGVIASLLAAWASRRWQAAPPTAPAAGSGQAATTGQVPPMPAAPSPRLAPSGRASPTDSKPFAG